jgi:hypothetical protein
MRTSVSQNCETATLSTEEFSPLISAEKYGGGGQDIEDQRDTYRRSQLDSQLLARPPKCKTVFTKSTLLFCDCGDDKQSRFFFSSDTLSMLLCIWVSWSGLNLWAIIHSREWICVRFSGVARIFVPCFMAHNHTTIPISLWKYKRIKIASTKLFKYSVNIQKSLNSLRSQRPRGKKAKVQVQVYMSSSLRLMPNLPIFGNFNR